MTANGPSRLELKSLKCFKSPAGVPLCIVQFKICQLFSWFGLMGKDQDLERPEKKDLRVQHQKSKKKSLSNFLQKIFHRRRRERKILLEAPGFPNVLLVPTTLSRHLALVVCAEKKTEMMLGYLKTNGLKPNKYDRKKSGPLINNLLEVKVPGI
jgi:hypothetical protein